MKFISLVDYNRMEQKVEKLKDNEVIAFSTGADYGFNKVVFGRKEFIVKKEAMQSVFANKSSADHFGQNFYFIFKDDGVIKNVLSETEGLAEKGIYTVKIKLEGTDNAKKIFINEIAKWSSGQKGYSTLSNGVTDREETVSMNGGLLFLGIFFGIVFSMCLLLIMYYKQITEGFDDMENFSIMQKVGMSDREVRGTIKRQILLVFFLPLLFAIFHTIAGLGMISELLGVLYLFNKTIIIAVCAIVACVFTILYGLSYALTSKVYYRIVRQMN